MSKAAKRSLFILIFLLVVSLGFAAYIVLEKGKLEKEVAFLNGELDQSQKREKKAAAQIKQLDGEIKDLNTQKAGLQKELQSHQNSQERQKSDY